jgi:hypothetical protein
VILSSEYRALGEEAITTYFKRLRFDAAGPSAARTHDLPFAKMYIKTCTTKVMLFGFTPQNMKNALGLSHLFNALLRRNSATLI